MSTEIKFRLWDKTNKWMDNDLLINSNGILYQDAYHKYDTPNKEIEMCKQNNFIFMQFTGLYDKNGVPICESDLTYVNGQLMVIRKGYHVTDSALEIKGFELGDIYGYYAESPRGSWRLNLGLALKKYKVFVIGNIYSNQEL